MSLRSLTHSLTHLQHAHSYNTTKHTSSSKKKPHLASLWWLGKEKKKSPIEQKEKNEHNRMYSTAFRWSVCLHLEMVVLLLWVCVNEFPKWIIMSCIQNINNKQQQQKKKKAKKENVLKA